MTSRLISIILIASFFSCTDKPSPGKSKTAGSGFELLDPQETGVTFNNTLKENPLTDRNVLAFRNFFHGAGTAVADFNRDGLQDIFFAGNQVPNELYINKGNFQFEKLGPESGINKNKVWSSGVSIIDINNDSYPDIYVCQQGPHPFADRKNLFYINNGDLTFTESAEEMGLDDGNSSTQACFFDFDKDGDLDCYVMNVSKYAGVALRKVFEELKKEENIVAASGKLFENIGNLKFNDVTKKAGLLKYGYGLGLVVSDFNNDNWPDIYVTNDYSVPDYMYINQKDGTFREEIKNYTRQISYFGMGCDAADINNDGLVDIAVVDMAAEDHFRDKTLMASMDVELFNYYVKYRQYQYQYMFNSLQLNNGNNSFSNIASLSGVLKSDWSWAALFGDYNMDGYKDYYVSNGVRRYTMDNDFQKALKTVKQENNGIVPLEYRKELYASMPEIKLENKLYINDGKLHFDDSRSSFSHPDYKSYSYGVAQADFDNDGDIDLVINNIDQPAMLLKNTARELLNNNYLKLRLNADSPSMEIGSKVYLYHDDQLQYLENFFIRGYESTMEDCLIFGLGKSNTVDSVKIVWPNDSIQIIENPAINQTLNISYSPTGILKKEKKQSGLLNQISAESIGIDFTHIENQFDDFEKEILLPQRQTAFGPSIASGDVNNDGLDDVFLGGAKGQSGMLYIQKRDGSFEEAKSQPWANEALSEDVDSEFIDLNRDGFLDLFVISGGSGEFVGLEPALQDRFYAGNGKGEFFRIANVMPESHSASYAIIPGNLDEDPDTEIIILGAAKPGRYPMSETSVVFDYANDSYTDVTETLIPELNDDNGLLRDAKIIDLDNDGINEIVTVGEWQQMHIFKLKNGQFKKVSDSWLKDIKKGWWRSIEAADLDGDGDLDLVVGNVGKNFKQKATKEYPLYLYSNDFDDNGTLDCVLAKTYKGKVVPARGKECSTEQMPFVSEKFKTYREYASASVIDIYGKDKLESSIALEANDFYSYILWNEGNKFTYEKLPVLAQAFPLNSTVTMDINNDGLTDLILAGNDYNTEYETPRLDAGNGLVLLNKGQRNFETLSISKSGIYCPGDVKRMRKLRIGGKGGVVVANNNARPDILVINN